MNLCLNMIVKDEAEVIIPTLENVLTHFPVTSWVIHDTGSSDSTREVIRDFFEARGISGWLKNTPWENFGHNRNVALQDARGCSDYVLFFDADNRIEGTLPELVPGADAYLLKTRRGSTVYETKAIIRNDGRYRWRGVVHEGLYLQPEFADHTEVVATVEGDYTLLSQSVGARSRDANTYYRDALMLQRAILSLAEEDVDLLPRYCFYCANSWKDAEAPHEAIHWYRRRIELGGWADEVYVAYLQLGLQLEKIGQVDEAVTTFLKGIEVCPDRGECQYHLARVHRSRGKFASTVMFAESGLKRARPTTGRLFVDDSIYDYWLDFEYLFAMKAMGVDIAPLASMKRFLASTAPDDLRSYLK